MLAICRCSIGHVDVNPLVNDSVPPTYRLNFPSFQRHPSCFPRRKEERKKDTKRRQFSIEPSTHNVLPPDSLHPHIHPSHHTRPCLRIALCNTRRPVPLLLLPHRKVPGSAPRGLDVLKRVLVRCRVWGQIHVEDKGVSTMRDMASALRSTELG